MAEGACQVQLSVPAMQVTSSHVSIWFDFLASYDEYTAVVKFGNVASEHVKSAISVVQPQLSAAQQKPSAVQQNRVGALVTHHPAWMSHHTGGSRQGHPRYTGAQQWEGRGWPDQEISQSAAHRYTKCKSCLTRTIRIVGVVHPIKPKQNLRVFWKLVNLQDCVWENHCRLIMKTILQEKETNSLHHYNLVRKFISMHQAIALDKEWENLRKFRPGT